MIYLVGVGRVYHKYTYIYTYIVYVQAVRVISWLYNENQQRVASTVYVSIAKV